MTKADYGECVYRLARICEVNEQIENKTKVKRLYYNDAEKISEYIANNKSLYFDTINRFIRNKYKRCKVQLNEVSGENAIREYKEGPVVVFPESEIRIGNDIFLNRNCNTVCMGINRSKLWIRLSLNHKTRSYAAVNRFYDKATPLAEVIGDAVFCCYKEILADNGFSIKAVYDITVFGVASTHKEVGKTLQQLEDPDRTMKDLFNMSATLFNSSREVIFPYFGLEKIIKNVSYYQPNNLKGFGWLCVNDPVDNGISIFLTKRSEKDESVGNTSFVGIGYPFTENDKVMQKATKDILALISPKI